ncbi:MAG TPA: hypothetical protein DCF33_19955 [Saprospirales bacterium]|nr:hypothetical protein [Saprospirales bacterium]
MIKQSTILACLLATANLFAQALTPEVTSWIINPGGETGYNNIPSNVQQVQYSAANVYVTTTCIPGYDIGPWAGNPNTPANQNFVFKITRNPQKNTGNLISTPLGHIGVWTNGVSVFNAKDAMSWQNQGIWNRNAIVAEGPSFDNCLGHPAPNGEYHHHLNPTCLYDDSDEGNHSPIVGYAFDGFPIYGCFGYANTDGTGGVKRMKSSYRKRNITVRQTKPDGTQLPANQYGPVVNGTYPLGLYLEDFEYVAGLGDLDEHNGRFCVTPEYPEGIYCYFITLDNNGVAEYPYILGPQYYGTVQAGNTGPQSGHNVPNEPVQTYSPTSGIPDVPEQLKIEVFPNPSEGKFILIFPETETIECRVYDGLGRVIYQQIQVRNGEFFQLTTPGVYFLMAQSANERAVKRLVVR